MEVQTKGEMGKLEAIVSGERVHRPLMDSHLTTEDLEKARVELNESPEVRERLLRRFKDMLADEKDFSPQMDDNLLLQFLRTRKFDLEGAHKLMRKYYKFRAVHRDWYPRSPSEISDVLRKTNIFDYPPYRDHMGRAIYHIKLGNWDPDKLPFKDFMAAGIMISEFVQDNPVTQVNGVFGLWDFKGFSFKHFLVVCSPIELWKLKTFVQMRFFDPGDLEGLHELFDPCILPPEYEGRMLKWDNQDIVKCLFEKEQYIHYSRSFGYKT